MKTKMHADKKPILGIIAGIAAALMAMGMIALFAILLFIFIPPAGSVLFILLIPIGVIAIGIGIIKGSHYYKGHCPYCELTAYGPGPIFKCRHCKRRIRVDYQSQIFARI